MARDIVFQDSTPSPVDPSINPLLQERQEKVNSDGWIAYTETYEPPNFGEEFQNHKFSIEPSTLSSELTNGGTNASWYLLSPTYNYIALQWEGYFEVFSDPEIQSPSIYVENSDLTEYKAFSGKTINKNTSKFFDEDLRPNFALKDPEKSEELKNFIFAREYHEEMNYRSRDKDQYPFYIQIDFFKRQNNTHISDKLKELNLYDELLRNYVETEKSTILMNNSEYPIFDLLAWASGEQPEQGTYFTMGKTQELNYLSRAFSISTFSDSINELITSRQRRLSEILSGEDCYSEALFYKVEKISNDTGQVVQTYWITAKDSSWSIVDTQVKYGQEYIYRQSACVAVLGAFVSGGVVSPSLKIIEVPVYSVNCNVVQPPQPVPDWNFSNNKNSTKELKISLSLNANNYDKVFIPLDLVEESQNEIMAKYNISGLRSDFQFETEYALFEIYRIDFHPKTYLDFTGNKIADVRHSSPSTSAMFRDKVTIGKEYYYVARSVNSHGLFSNPTPIYKVVLNRDADETFLEIEPVEFLQPEKTQINLMFQKLLQLLPSTLQTIYDLEPLRQEDPSTLRGKLDLVSLGIAEEPVWGRTFKFRITSTDTGKKIDLNINVKLTTNKTSEDS